jgi:hypothetical protein
MTRVRRLRKLLRTPRLALACLAVACVASVAAPVGVAASAQGAPVRLTAELACLPTGGATVTFSVQNLGRTTLRMADDFHLELTAVRRGGAESTLIAFVFPIPELAVIEPGGKSTFIVPMGDAIEEGEVGADLSGRRLVLEAEVFFEGRPKPARRVFSFPACPAPVA